MNFWTLCLHIDFQYVNKKNEFCNLQNSSYFLFYPSKSVVLLSPVIVGMVRSNSPTSMLSFTPIITTHIAEIAFLHCLPLNKKCFIFRLYISLKFRIFAISFQQLPHSVIDWGTIKNILLSYENNARNIYNTVLVSSFVYNQALLAFISRRLWCSIRYLTLAFCSRVFCFAFHYRFRSGITAGIMELRIYGITEIGLRVATKGGIMESRIGQSRI